MLAPARLDSQRIVWLAGILGLPVIRAA